MFTSVSEMFTASGPCHVHPERDLRRDPCCFAGFFSLVLTESLFCGVLTLHHFTDQVLVVAHISYNVNCR